MTNTTSIISSINFINTVLVPAMEMTKAMHDNGFRSHVAIPLKDVLTPDEQEAIVDSWECALTDDLWNAGAPNRGDNPRAEFIRMDATVRYEEEDYGNENGKQRFWVLSLTLNGWEVKHRATALVMHDHDMNVKCFAQPLFLDFMEALHKEIASYLS